MSNLGESSGTVLNEISRGWGALNRWGEGRWQRESQGCWQNQINAISTNLWGSKVIQLTGRTASIQRKWRLFFLPYRYLVYCEQLLLLLRRFARLQANYLFPYFFNVLLTTNLQRSSEIRLILMIGPLMTAQSNTEITLSETQEALRFNCDAWRCTIQKY